jgi:hypothetical protein
MAISLKELLPLMGERFVGNAEARLKASLEGSEQGLNLTGHIPGAIHNTYISLTWINNVGEGLRNPHQLQGLEILH